MFSHWWGAVLIATIAGSPWLVGIVWLWRNRPSDGEVLPSLGDELRKRLWTR